METSQSSHRKCVPQAVQRTVVANPVLAVVRSHDLSSQMGTAVQRFEAEFAAYAGASHAVATSSGTTALHTALITAGVGVGDDVIVPAYTFIATATAVLHHNAIPTFVDVEPDTWNMDVAKLEEAITPSTKGIMPVHLNGYPADMDKVNAIAKKHNLVVIEDACQSHGALYKGKKRVPWATWLASA